MRNYTVSFLKISFINHISFQTNRFLILVYLIVTPLQRLLLQAETQWRVGRLTNIFDWSGKKTHSSISLYQQIITCQDGSRESIRNDNPEIEFYSWRAQLYICGWDMSSERSRNWLANVSWLTPPTPSLRASYLATEVWKYKEIWLWQAVVKRTTRMWTNIYNDVFVSSIMFVCSWNEV